MKLQGASLHWYTLFVTSDTRSSGRVCPSVSETTEFILRVVLVVYIGSSHVNVVLASIYALYRGG
jgi:hypothetical protein